MGTQASVARLAGVLHLAAGGSTGPILPATVAAAVVCADCAESACACRRAAVLALSSAC